MIFVTVGSQLPFDRLIRAVDEWAERNKDQEIIAQIGNSDYIPKNMSFFQTLTPDQYSNFFHRADFVIAHAGMGTIISALEHGKPLLLLPRLANMGEHRNDHQLATARRFSSFKNIIVADNAFHLTKEIYALLKNGPISSTHVEPEVSAQLISAIKKYANDE